MRAVVMPNGPAGKVSLRFALSLLVSLFVCREEKKGCGCRCRARRVLSSSVLSMERERPALGSRGGIRWKRQL